MLKLEFRFDKIVISDQRLRGIDRDFGYLLYRDKIGTMTFQDLQENKGINLMISMLIHFANVKGRCGVEEPVSANYRQSIFCIWSVEQRSTIKGAYGNKTLDRQKTSSFSHQKDEDMVINSGFDQQFIALSYPIQNGKLELSEKDK